MSNSNRFKYDLAAFIDFRDATECKRVRQISREALTEHPNPDFQIRIIESADHFYTAFAKDFVSRVRDARDSGEEFVALLPVGPMPQYEIAAKLINKQSLSLRHVHSFNMDEYANEDGETAPISWAGSFQKAMWDGFFGLIDPELRPPEDQIHFPTGMNINSYSDQIEAVGGADVCYGGIGWCGHIAFWESHLGAEFKGDLDAFKQAGSRIVEWVPPKAVTIGPRDIISARHRSFWLDGDIGGGVSWQRFIARLVAHGPVSEFVPGSILQTTRADYTLLGPIANNVEIKMS